MKVAVLGDTHFGVRNDSLIFHKHFEKFYNEVFFPYLKEHDILHVVQLGDVFDRRKYINFSSLHNSRQYFFDKINQEYSSWMLIGNHDTYHKNTNAINSPELLLESYHNINKINTPVEVDFEDCKVLLVPWICEENERQCVEAIRNTNAQVIMGHFELNGFEMYRGTVCEEGMDSSIFNGKKVVSGHFHHMSQVGNILYVGTPYQMTWSDFGDTKGFHIFDTDTKELTFIENPFTMFHKLHYDDQQIKSVADIGKMDFTHLAGCYVKVIVRNKDNPTWFDVFVDKLEKAGVADLQVVEDHFHLDLEDDDDIINEAEDTLTILSKYIDQLELQSDRARLDNLMRTLYHEALSMES